MAGMSDSQVAQVVSVLRMVLGDDLVGAYLHGSALLGGLRHQSDVDVLGVTRRRLTLDEKRRLVGELLPISGRPADGSPRPVELTLVVQADVRPWRFPPRRELQYGEWLRRDFESGADAPWRATTDPDLAVLITMVLRGDSPLVGPPPADVLDPVPREDYVAAMVDGLDGLLRELGPDTRNIVLTLARIWSSVATDQILRKDGAADWALARVPDEHRAVLQRARAGYLGDESDRWDGMDADVRRAADHLVAEIRHAAARSPTAPR